MGNESQGKFMVAKWCCDQILGAGWSVVGFAQPLFGESYVEEQNNLVMDNPVSFLF